MADVGGREKDTSNESKAMCSRCGRAHADDVGIMAHEQRNGTEANDAVCA